MTTVTRTRPYNNLVESEEVAERLIENNRLVRAQMKDKYNKVSHIEFYYHNRTKEVERVMKVIGITKRELILQSIKGNYRESFFYESLAYLEEHQYIKCA